MCVLFGKRRRTFESLKTKRVFAIISVQELAF